jgi:1,4-alpha-glucan branching enzyme
MNSQPIATLGQPTEAETAAQPVVARTGKSKRITENAAGKVKLATQPISERFPALEEQEVMLTYFAPLARQVNVAGNFNSWRPEAAPLTNTDTGEWVVRLMLRSGQYEYLFVVDGRWTEDPQATQRIANPHGGFNSVLLVPLSVRMSIL